MSMVGAAATVAGYSVMKKTLSGLQDIASGELKKKLKKLANERKQDEIASKIRKLGLVKTLLESRFEVDLKTIYHPTMVECGDDYIRVSNIDKLPDHNGLLVEGTVGQGKSTFMRFLVCSMAQFNNEIPIFLEFRNIKKEEGLTGALKRQLDIYGFEADDELFDFYCKSGKFVLFLDGFDELKSEDVQGVVVELGDLRHKYSETLKILVSSRPGNKLSDHPLFQQVKVLPISGDDRLEFLRRIDNDKERSERLVDALKVTDSEIINVLSTPLMLTLLSKIHSAFNQVPDTFIEFYEKLFMAMYKDHDDRKPGFNRTVKSSLSPSQVEDIFSLFSFFCSANEMFAFNRKEYYQNMQLALEKSGISTRVDDLMDDIVEISCMVIKEGEIYQFIHKSICEYYAAKYVSKNGERFKKIFYSKALSCLGVWQQQLCYLMEIDRVAFYKYLFIPSCKNSASFRDDISSNGSYVAVQNLLSQCFIGFDEGKYISHVDYKDEEQYQQIFDQDINLTFEVMSSFFDRKISQLIPDLEAYSKIDTVFNYELIGLKNLTYFGGENLINNRALIASIAMRIEKLIPIYDQRMVQIKSVLDVDENQCDMLSGLFI